MIMHIKNSNKNLREMRGDWYMTGLLWTENKLLLNNSKSGSLGHLKSLLRRLEQNPKTFKAYDEVIRD